MANLTARAPFDGLLPIELGSARLAAVDLGVVTRVTPFPGHRSELARTMQAAHGLDWVAPGGIAQVGDIRLVWCGREAAFLIGTPPDERLRSHAALTEQSDAFAAARLGGPAALDVLARLVPVDLRSGPAVVQSLLGHIPVTLIRAESGFEILAFRSMAGSVAHEIADAMASVEGRAALG